MTRPLLHPPPRRVAWGRAEAPVADVAEVTGPGFGAEGYRLRADSGRVTIESSTPAGRARARATLGQLTGEGAVVPDVDIEDAPAFPVRGLLVDISRDKVPTLDTLVDLVDLMAGWKLNHLELYTEHTFAYTGHPLVWRDASPVTAEDLAVLRRRCAEHHIELTANQACLGHMERWLALERYRPLAAAPDGWLDGRGRRRAPTTLEPTNPASLSLCRELLAELLGHVPGGRVHVNLDEPWELAATGRGADYLDYLAALRHAPELDGREMLVWGDIVASDPALADRLPAGVTVCEWGYEANHPFAARVEALASAGVDHWVCPGTSSWNSVVGRLQNAVGNIDAAVAAGARSGAGGVLLTDWGDNGHLQPLAVSLPGVAAAAEAAWTGKSVGAPIAAVLDSHCFAGEGAGAAICSLGDAYLRLTPRLVNASAAVHHLLSPQMQVGRGWTEGLDGGQLEELSATVADARAGLAGASVSPAAGPVVDEMDLAAALVALGADDAGARLRGDGTLGSVPATVRAALAGRAQDLAARHRELWVARNRPGGLADSAARLDHLAACYRAGRGTAFVPAWHPRFGDEEN